MSDAPRKVVTSNALQPCPGGLKCGDCGFAMMTNEASADSFCVNMECIRHRVLLLARGAPVRARRGAVVGPMGSVPDDSVLDAGIAPAVEVLRAAGVETFESCEGGDGHAFSEPTVRFHGERPEGFRALAAAMQNGLPVSELRRVWPVIDGEPTGPWWELTFTPTTSEKDGLMNPVHDGSTGSVTLNNAAR